MKKPMSKEEIKEFDENIAQVQKLIENLARLETKAENMEDGPEKDALKSFVEIVKKSVLDPIYQSLIKYNESYEKYAKSRDSFIESYPADTFWGDLLRVEQYGDMDAARRLAAKWFPIKAVFHTDRWNIIKPYFYKRTEDRNRRIAWEELVIPSLFLALGNAKDGDLALVGHPKTVRGNSSKLKLGDIRRKGNYRWLRNEIRVVIERDLLDGFTSDSTEFQSVINDMGETPEAKELEDEAQREINTFSSERTDTLFALSSEIIENIDMVSAISHLNDKEREVILRTVSGYTDEELASRLDVSQELIRKWRERGLKKIRKFLE